MGCLAVATCWLCESLPEHEAVRLLKSCVVHIFDAVSQLHNNIPVSFLCIVSLKAHQGTWELHPGHSRSGSHHLYLIAV